MFFCVASDRLSAFGFLPACVLAVVVCGLGCVGFGGVEVYMLEL